MFIAKYGSNNEVHTRMAEGTMHHELYLKNAGRLPDDLLGYFTSPIDAKRLVDRWQAANAENQGKNVKAAIRRKHEAKQAEEKIED